MELFEVSSSATSTEEIYRGVGNPIYPPAAAELKRRGIQYSKRRAKQITEQEAEYYDLLICMDESNVRNTKRLLGDGADKKIKKLMDYTERGGIVSDPWYTDRFDIAFDDIYEGCEGLLKRLLSCGECSESRE